MKKKTLPHEKIGITELEWAQRRASGTRWCWRGKHWVLIAFLHHKRKGVCVDCAKIMRHESIKRIREREKQHDIHVKARKAAGGNEGLW